MSALPAAERDGRLFSLDILRGLAVFLVLWRHIPIKARLDLGTSERLVNVLNQIGWCGVDLFYVLSGLLISNLLFREYKKRGALDVPRFWVRRCFKIWPCYFIGYGAMVVLNLAWWGILRDRAKLQYHLASILPNVFFVQNYVHPLKRWDNSWSIAVEEHFYLLLPLLLVGVAAWGRAWGEDGPRLWFRHLLPLGALFAAICLLARLDRALQGGDWIAVYYPTHLRFDSLFCGVVLGYCWNFHADRLRAIARYWPALLACVPLTLAVPYFFPVVQSKLTLVLGFTLIYLAFGGLVLLAAVYPDFGRTGPARGLWGFLAWMGVYSYTLYIAHSVIYDLPGITHLRPLIVRLCGGPDSLGGVWGDRLFFYVLTFAGGVGLAVSTSSSHSFACGSALFPSRDAAERAAAPVAMPPAEVVSAAA